jgi:hypothetical protein
MEKNIIDLTTLNTIQISVETSHDTDQAEGGVVRDS